MNKNIILIFSAHAADFCSRAGGTIVKHLKRNDHVHVIDLTYGERGESPVYWELNKESSLKEAKMQRKKEAINAARILGVTIEFLDYDDYPLIINKERIHTLVKFLQNIRPNIVLTHWNYDPTNLDHSETTKAVISAINCAKEPGFNPNKKPIARPQIFFFESTIPITEFNRFSPDIYIDITNEFEVKSKALECFTSQPFLKDWYTNLAMRRAHQVKTWTGKEISFSEGFKKYTPLVTEYLPVHELYS